MSFITRNVFRALVQGSQLSKGLHTSAVNGDKNVGCREVIGNWHENAKEGRIKCTLIPGDGVGPELVYSVQEVFKAANIPVDFEPFFFSEVNPTLSAPLEDVVNSIARNKICIKGILATPDFSHTGELQTLNMKLRSALDLFANVVHVKSLPNVKCRHHDVDCIIIREQIEGEYSALEHESVPGVVECLKIITRAKSERIAKFAFDYAVKLGRKKVTAVHKANIMKLGDGLFLKSCEEMSKMYPRIEFEKMIVDNCTMQMVANPNQFDVMVTPNLYGNIVDNLASGLVGGAGVVAGASYSADCAVFEQGARHVFSGAVGKNIANPTAMLMASANLLAHVNLSTYSRQLKQAVYTVLTDGKVRTKDLGGQNTTKDFTNAVIHCLT
ncbi:probable isocitrate dehydrogenase [NAD] subunit beta, mitochondrial isoform X2 [Plutella xylostella]|uniref:probable isocitrate dehydrogenase [NAD] subunit beta, mitochondrial isoform X1 n=1 Tax=Plutella xylostella TaxID=51655 RepID=UPI0005D0E233|nr:probable isocitrate dehydrogenase [NAD] subunit beta, mitochondrial isoform X1 [Plutella xylostella]XP_048486567.1 probable isocitrate dehydrogenase [NAD] subunit beta, mitochondrial isoform X2 [Plutella xylostella]